MRIGMSWLGIAAVVAGSIGCGGEDAEEAAPTAASSTAEEAAPAPDEPAPPPAQFQVAGQPFHVVSVLVWEEDGFDPGEKSMLVRLHGTERQCETPPPSADTVAPLLNCGMWNSEGSVAGPLDSFLAAGEHRFGCRWFGPGTETVNNATGTFTVTSHTDSAILGTIAMTGGGATGSMEVTATRCPAE